MALELVDLPGYAAGAGPGAEVAGALEQVDVRVIDSEGRAVPFASYRLLDGKKELARGRAFADGSFVLETGGLLSGSGARALSLEVTSRGGAAVLPFASPPLDASGKPEPLRVRLSGAHRLAEPLCCDLVFVVDTTVSMSRWMKSLERAIEYAADAVSRRGDLVLRLGLVLFRDRGDDYLVKVRPLSPDLGAFRAALAGISASGGGDIPEDLGAGLQAAVEGMDYAEDSLRLVFAVTDAPPSSRPATPAEGMTLPEAIEAARAKGIKIHAVGVGALPSDAETALRRLAARSGGVYLAAAGGRADLHGRGDAIVRGSLGDLMVRIVAGDVQAATAGGLAARDPALDLLGSVQSRMMAGLAYPEAARLRKAEGRALVSLIVASDGSLRRARIVAGSGSAILDKAALALAASVFPVGNPAGCEVELEIAVVYRLGP